MTTTTITGVRVFDGEELLEGTYAVSFDENAILAIDKSGSRPTASEVVIEGDGATLAPGLIDAHVHIRSVDQLDTLAAFGVTTAFDMSSWPAEFVAEMRRHSGGADIRSAGTSIAGTNGPHSHIPGYPAESLISTPEQARSVVELRVSEGVDYIKIIAERPGGGGPDLATATAVVDTAHEHGLAVVAHASSLGAVKLAQAAGVDILTHAPLDAPIDESAVEWMVSHRLAIVPTLTMMQGTARNLGIPALTYDSARETVRLLHAAGVPIAAGTDANNAPGVPASVSHGSSLHEELVLLVDAGLSPIEALRSATSIAAATFGLSDRGVIAVGKRPDLVLIDGDPTTNIGETQNIRGIWACGKEIAANRVEERR